MNDPADISNSECSFCDALNAKHPPAQPLQPKCFLSTMDTPSVHPVVSDALDTTVVHATALCTVGAVKPFWIDACG